nr:uncharacterized protein LOC106679164 [Halyomorpha halys]
MDQLKEKLKSAECPSNWGLAEFKDRKPATFIIDKLLNRQEEIADSWYHVCINLTVAYLHSENKDVTKAIGILEECDSILNSTTDDLIVKYKPAILSVYNASKASILSLSSTPSEVKMFSDKVVRIEDLDVQNQAALLALKANVFSKFGVSGSNIALQYAKEALKKNDKEAEWHFLLGKLLGRLRHFTEDHEISPAEISYLKTAFNLAGTSCSATFLANAYIQKSKTLHFEKYKTGICPAKEIRDKIHRYSAKAKELMK